ncbi:MAG: tetratricopeptide repeat protein [Chthoniobacter sp.]|uniref:tetratricopeptide repeat protein n=1 Tax=Chthoniobacter sp. TaxID=2510640 RepID=UPI0032ACA997
MRRAFLFSTLVAASGLFFVAKGRASEASEELIRKGDVYYARLEPSEALKYYLPAEKLDPNNPQLLVRIARQYRHLMSETAAKEQKKQLCTTAVGYAQRAVAIAPNDPDTQLAVAISYGKLLPLVGTGDQIADSRLIKSAVDKTLALDANNDLAWQILGRWYLALADVSGVKRALAQIAYGKLPPARYEDAVRCFEKAIELNPNRLMHHIELGRTYMQMGRTTEARKCLAKGLSLPNTEKDDPETKDLGRELLGKLH